MRFIIGLLLLAGCAVPDTAPTPDTCNAARFAPLVGSPATRLERVYMLGKIRVWRPGRAASLEHDPERVNIRVDDAGQIASVSCG